MASPLGSRIAYPGPVLAVEDRVAELLAQMTMSEKIGQMTLVSARVFSERRPRGWTSLLRNGHPHESDITRLGIGAVFSGGGGHPADNTARGWLEWVDGLQRRALTTRLRIPLLFGVDAVHGHATLGGAVVFPHNIGLGATRDPDLVERAARITALEVAATGIRWGFAPVVAVARDLRWGRTYESFSEDPAVVSALGAAHVRGLQGRDGGGALPDRTAVMATAKHYVGDGGTVWGSATTGARRIDQGVTDVGEDTLRRLHLPPYVSAIQAGVGSIMASYSSWGDARVHASRYLLTDVLRGELGFEGILLSDWKAVDQVSPDYGEAVARCVNAGIDLVMVPNHYQRFIRTMKEVVRDGRVSKQRIDEAVGRVLAAKFRLGLFERPMGSPGDLSRVGSAEHRRVAREAVRKSLVLLSSREGVLPIPRDVSHLLVAGRAADDIGLQCGGWTIEWQGGSGPITPGTSILAGIRRAVAPSATVEFDPTGRFERSRARVSRAEFGLAVVGESPYAEFKGDREDLGLAAEDLAVIHHLRPLCEKLVVILVSGRPVLIADHLSQWDAAIAAWLPGTEGQGVSDVLFGDYPFVGRLPFTWPRAMEDIPVERTLQSERGVLFPFGHGLSAEDPARAGTGPDR